MIIGAAPAAFIGAKITLSTPGQYLEVLIAIFIALAGINALRGQKVNESSSNISNRFVLIFIGVVAGIGSALTGTGGPLIVVPIMVSLKVAAHTAIGFSQVIQLPIASLATLSNFLYGSVDLIVGGVIAGGVIIGSLFGAKLAHLFSSRIMQRILSIVLVVVGVGMIGRILWY